VKTISVKEAAEALGVSPRAIQYKLQNGDLKGTRTKNQYGVAEWRVWPNKDISAALSQKQGFKDEAAINFEPTEEDTIEAEEVNHSDEDFDGPKTWRDVEIERLELMAEKLVKPMAERIESQAVALREQEKIIEDQKRQLRLLPDFQKQAEDERKAAEIRALEVVALNKQIAALEEQRLELEAKAGQATELAGDLQALKEKVNELQRPWWRKVFAPGKPST
jgi:hypothetical protein